MIKQGFKGGIHPQDFKQLSKDKSFVKIKAKGEFVFPLSMHIGAPSKCVVEIGEKVKCGQLIGKAEGFVSSNIFSSVSGTVTDIKSIVLPNSVKSDAIVIEPSGNADDKILFDTKNSLEEWTSDEIVERVRDAGIVGMGGAGFPTFVKLSPKDRNLIDTILINAAECEPYITADYRRIIENTDEIITGCKILLKVFPKAKVIIAVEDNKIDAIKILKNATHHIENITVKKLKTKYPQGGERQLIYATLNRKINSSMLPFEKGVIVDNIETVFNIEEAIMKGMPLIYRTMTLQGQLMNNPCNVIAPIGMNSRIIIEEMGGIKESDDLKIISGGPMMGFSMESLDSPVTKTSSSILAIKNNSSKVTNCINCGRCVTACPENLLPSKLAKYSENNQMEDFEKIGGLECIECGCCSFVCPAKKYLKQSITLMKKQILSYKKNSK